MSSSRKLPYVWSKGIEGHFRHWVNLHKHIGGDVAVHEIQLQDCGLYTFIVL
jgi:hypothetical protein